MVREIFRMLVESRAAKGIQFAIDWVCEQKIIPRRIAVDDLFDEVTADPVA